MHDARSLQSLDALKSTANINHRSGNRVAITLDGFCSVRGGKDVACSTNNISMSGVSLITVAEAAVGDEIKLSLSQIGLQTGRVARLLTDGIAIEFDVTISPKFLRVINWMRHGRTEAERMTDEREHARIVPLKRLVKITRESGTEFYARAIDLSRSGIAINNMVGLNTGERVSVGSHIGAVARCWPGAAAIAFDRVLQADGFDITIELI